MLKPLRFSRSQSGDTIVEVLITIAVISLILVTAYAVTNRNTRRIQDTQERNQALQLAQQQVEFLRVKGPLTGGNTCFDSSGNPTGGASCTVNNGGAAYQLGIGLSSTGSFAVNVNWQNLLNNQQDTITLYYRPQQ